MENKALTRMIYGFVADKWMSLGKEIDLEDILDAIFEAIATFPKEVNKGKK